METMAGPQIDLRKGYREVIKKYGRERLAQLDLLCLYLGTATQKNIDQVADSCPVIQVVGLFGTGKTSLLHCLLENSNIPFTLADCSFSCIDNVEWGTRSGVVVDTILNPTLEQLVTMLRRTVPSQLILPQEQIVSTHSMDSKLNSSFREGWYFFFTSDALSLRIKAASSCEKFFVILLDLLEQWTHLYQTLYGEDCILPTPVLVFDQAEILATHQPLIFKLLSQIPTFVASSTNTGKLLCRCCEIIVIFSSSTALNELPFVPIVFFKTFSKHSRINALQKLFPSHGLPMAIYLAEWFQQSPSLQDICHHMSHTVETPANLDLKDDQDTTSQSLASSDSYTTSLQEDTEECMETQLDLDHNLVPQSIICVSPKVNYPTHPDAYWIDYAFLDSTSQDTIKVLEVSVTVIKKLWTEFLYILTPHLGGIRAFSDFHEIIFFLRRLWAIYLQPLLHLDNFLVDFLIAGDLDGMLQEMRAKLEQHAYCSKLSQLTLIRHFEPASFILHPYFSVLSGVVTKFPLPPYAPLNRYEGSFLSLILILAAYTASRTPPSHDARLLGHKRGSQNVVMNKSKQEIDSSECRNSFSYLRWIYLCQILFLYVGQPLPMTLVIYEQAALLMHIRFIDYVERDATPAVALYRNTKLVSLTPESIVSNLAQRVDLSLDFLLSA